MSDPFRECVARLAQADVRIAQLLTERDEARAEVARWRKQVGNISQADTGIIVDMAQDLEEARAEAAALRATAQALVDKYDAYYECPELTGPVADLRAALATEGAGREWVERYAAFEPIALKAIEYVQATTDNRLYERPRLYEELWGLVLKYQREHEHQGGE